MCQGLVTYIFLPGIVDGPVKWAYIMEEKAKGTVKERYQTFPYSTLLQLVYWNVS